MKNIVIESKNSTGRIKHSTHPEEELANWKVVLKKSDKMQQRKEEV